MRILEEHLTALAAESGPAGAEFERDPRDPEIRLSRLLDDGTSNPMHPRDTTGVHAVRGLIDGAKVIAYCTDATAMGGAMGTEGCRHIVEAIEAAVRERCPVIGLWHSGGARLTEGVSALDAVGQVFAAMVRASGRVPQISVILGPAAGGAAYGPALTDIVIMTKAARVFVTGPDIVRSVTGEHIDMAGLGGPDVHATRSGVVHVVAEDENDVYRRTRRLAGMFTRPGVFNLHATQHDTEDLTTLLPKSSRRAYDIRPLIRHLLDSDETSGFEELQPKWAPNIVVGLGRLAGRTIGVIANNPLRKGGCLDSASAEKASRFVRMCDAFGIPMAVLVDVPGYLPGVEQEWGGVVRRGAKLLHAFSEALVPRVTLVIRKAYGGAYIAMNARCLGATAVFAWPGAEVAVMGARAAVGLLHRKVLAAVPAEQREAVHATLAEEHERNAGGVHRALAIGAIDEVIEPLHTRHRLAEALASSPAGRGAHGNIPL